MMIVKMDNTKVIDKMSELCSELLEQDAYKKLRAMIDEFVHDEASVEQYKGFLQLQQRLEQKEESSIKLSPEEISAYENEELALYDNPTVRQYLFAEQEFNKLHRLISQFFTTTIEMNRVPELSELKKEGCGCGGSCGGGH